MTRPHEPFADAIRTARAIVELEGRALTDAGYGPAFDRAYDLLVLKIAQAIVDAEEAARESYRPRRDD